MKIEFAYFSKQGRKEGNQDSVLPPFKSNGAWWAAVADGMGGHKGGDVASAAVVDAVNSVIKTQHETDISKLFVIAQDRLKAIAVENPDLSSMGTTLSLIRLFD